MAMSEVDNSDEILMEEIKSNECTLLESPLLTVCTFSLAGVRRKYGAGSDRRREKKEESTPKHD